MTDNAAHKKQVVHLPKEWLSDRLWIRAGNNPSPATKFCRLPIHQDKYCGVDGIGQISSLTSVIHGNALGDDMNRLKLTAFPLAHDRCAFRFLMLLGHCER